MKLPHKCESATFPEGESCVFERESVCVCVGVCVCVCLGERCVLRGSVGGCKRCVLRGRGSVCVCVCVHSHPWLFY